MKSVTLTYYLEIISSWCHWAEPMWAQLKSHYAGQVDFQWKIAMMSPEDFPVSVAQTEWFYQRSGGTVMHSPYKLDTGWFETSRKGHYEAPNLVAEAAKDFGFTGDEIRLALTHAAVCEGKKVGDLAVSVAIAAKTGKINPKKLLVAASSKEIQARVDAGTAEFLAHRINQRPSFILTDAIGDKAVFSGLVRTAPLAATIETMLSDSAAYAAHAVHHGKPPGK